MDSPPVKVRYSDLPDSPIQRVAYEVPSDTIHTTPQRKPRRRNEVPNGLERKRQKTSRNTWSTCATSDGIIDSPSQSASPRGAAGHGDPRAEEWRSDELLPIQPEESESSMTDCGYPAFVHSVLSDDCEFYQLNQTIFVVNGWNTKTNEPSVSLGPHLLDIPLSPFTRRCGTICNETLSMIQVFCAFVLKEGTAQSVSTFAL